MSASDRKAPLPHDERLAHYLEYLAAERGLAPNTLAAYRSDLQRLARSMGRRPLERAREEDLLRALRHMRVAGSSPRASARAVTGLGPGVG